MSDTIFHLSDLGPSCCENLDAPALNSNSDQQSIQTKDPETQVNSSSDQSCSVASSPHTAAVSLPQRSCELNPVCRGSNSPNQNRFVTLTLTSDNLKSSRVYLPLPFLRENGITKPGMVTLLGNDGTRRLANLLQEKSGRMSLGKGFKSFSRANGLKVGESFTLELTWENATPLLALVSNESRKHNSFVTLTLTHDSLRKCRLGLPLPFMRENGMTNPGTITLLGKDGTEWTASLLRESTGRMSLGKGWSDFAKGNCIEISESFTLEAIWKDDETPMLCLSNIDFRSDAKCECSKAEEKESLPK